MGNPSQIFADYRYMDPESRKYTQVILFHDLIETVIHNRDVARGPQTLQAIIKNDIKEYETLLNYEACWLYRDTRERFKDDILEIDEGYHKKKTDF